MHRAILGLTGFLLLSLAGLWLALQRQRPPAPVPVHKQKPYPDLKALRLVISPRQGFSNQQQCLRLALVLAQLLTQNSPAADLDKTCDVTFYSLTFQDWDLALELPATVRPVRAEPLPFEELYDLSRLQPASLRERIHLGGEAMGSCTGNVRLVLGPSGPLFSITEGGGEGAACAQLLCSYVWTDCLASFALPSLHSVYLPYLPIYQQHATAIQAQLLADHPTILTAFLRYRPHHHALLPCSPHFSGYYPCRHGLGLEVSFAEAIAALANQSTANCVRADLAGAPGQVYLFDDVVPPSFPREWLNNSVRRLLVEEELAALVPGHVASFPSSITERLVQMRAAAGLATTDELRSYQRALTYHTPSNQVRPWLTERIPECWALEP